eukprot:1266883-Alexandrium_andersonii.AAC.1
MRHRLHGAVEKAARQLEGFIRASTLALQERIQGEILVDRPAMLWLVGHAGELLAKHLAGHDGRAAFERFSASLAGATGASSASRRATACGRT